MATASSIRGGDAVVVVFEHEDHRQLPDGGHVHAFVPVAGVAAGIAGEGHRHAVLAAHLEGQRRAHGQRDPGADDGQRAQAAGLEGGDVHRAAAALAVAGLLAQDLGHHPRGVGALGDVVAVAAVRAGDQVIGAQRHAHADAGRFLADVGVDGALDLAALEEIDGGQLELADAHHPAVHLEVERVVQRHCDPPPGKWQAVGCLQRSRHKKSASGMTTCASIPATGGLSRRLPEPTQTWYHEVDQHPQQDSNPQPPDPKSDALSVELWGRVREL